MGVLDDLEKRILEVAWWRGTRHITASKFDKVLRSLQDAIKHGSADWNPSTDATVRSCYSTLRDNVHKVADIPRQEQRINTLNNLAKKHKLT